MINIDITGSYHRPFWFPFASVYVPVTPCVLDGSLSFLEMVWKLLRDLNKTIEATNANHTDILSLVEEINKLYGTKLSYIEVNFTQPNPVTARITADTDYSDIVKAYADGIVLGRFNGDLYIALGYEDDNRVVSFYSLNGLHLRRIADNENRISYNEYQIITNIGGTITGVLNLTHTPVAATEAANKKYVDEQDAITLQDAKDYADQQDAVTLQAAKDYADQQDAVTLQAAKNYADQQDAVTLQAAEAYADHNFVRTDGYSGNTYASRNQTETTFTDIPSSPNTITISELLAKLAGWYQEIKNKITRVSVINDNGVYKCNKTFAEIYQLFTEGQEVQIVYDNPLLTRETSIMRTERYGPSSITFSGDDHTCTINSSDVITFS